MVDICICDIVSKKRIYNSTWFKLEPIGDYKKGLKIGKWNSKGKNYDIDFVDTNDLLFNFKDNGHCREMPVNEHSRLRFKQISTGYTGIIDGYWEWVVAMFDSDYEKYGCDRYRMAFDESTTPGEYYIDTEKKGNWGMRQGSIYNGNNEEKIKFKVYKIEN